MCDLKRVFDKTVLLLKRDGLWPENGADAEVDYALGNEIRLLDKPEEYDINFRVDFGSSEGIYIDLFADIRYPDEKESTTYNLGTIKTLSDSREAYATYAALGANFVYFARREMYLFIERSFPSYSMKFYIYSMDVGDTRLGRRTLNADEVITNMEVYVSSYRPIGEGSFRMCNWNSDTDICEYLRDKAMIENVYPFGPTDIIALERTNRQTGQVKLTSYLYDGMADAFLSCNLHDFNLCKPSKEVCHG